MDDKTVTIDPPSRKDSADTKVKSDKSEGQVITFDQFQKIDIRIGTVIKAEIPEWSHWVIKLKVDFGKEVGKRIIFAGLMKFYKPEELEKKQFPFVINIKPKKIGPEGDYSEGMLLAAETDNEDNCVLLVPDSKIASGSKIH